MNDAEEVRNATLRVMQFLQSGQLDAAEATCRHLLQAVPDAAEPWFALGAVSMRRQAYAAAESALTHGLSLHPSSATAWNDLAIALNKQGKGAEAEAAAQRGIALDNTSSAAWSSLGAAFYTQERWREACDALRRSLTLDPQNAALWNNLGSAEIKLERFEAAKEALERALALAPGNMGSISNIAYLLCCQGRREDASHWLQKQIALDPQLPETWICQGKLWEAMAEWSLAVAAYRRALAIAPKNQTANYELARMLRAQRLPSAAEETARALLADVPGHADGWALLGELLAMQGRSEEGISAQQRAWELAPSDDRHARWLMGLQYVENISPERLLTAHRQWDAQYARALLPAENVRAVGTSSARSLRLGFVSSDFGRHPIGFLALPALERLDRNACSVVCYADRLSGDEYTTRFRAATHSWRVTSSLSDQELADQIRADRIDILVDLMGHTGKRLLVFARQPAPLQVTWLGYVGTTGMSAMDCLLADRFHVREGEETYYAERVLRMPHAYGCYGPPADAPIVGPLPAPQVGYITFACFNNPAKYSPRVLEAWATILRNVKTARLLLKYGALDDPQVQTYWRHWFECRGVEPERIMTEGWSPPTELLAHYNRVDLSLDTQPYSGGLTTCESLWMGVPVITFPGKTFAGRHATSYVSNAGYSQFVARDLAGYIELAIHWAGRINELAALRKGMRDVISRSPLCAAQSFANDFLSVLSAAWEAKAGMP